MTAFPNTAPASSVTLALPLTSLKIVPAIVRSPATTAFENSEVFPLVRSVAVAVMNSPAATAAPIVRPVEVARPPLSVETMAEPR